MLKTKGALFNLVAFLTTTLEILSRTNKKKTFSIGLRSDTENGQMIYVDENNGIYRAFLDPKTKEYFYYDSDGHPVYCYSQRKVNGEKDHIEIKPLVLPEIIILTDSIQ